MNEERQHTGFVCGYCGKWMPSLSEVRGHRCGPMREDAKGNNGKARVER